MRSLFCVCGKYGYYTRDHNADGFLHSRKMHVSKFVTDNNCKEQNESLKEPKKKAFSFSIGRFKTICIV